MDYGDVMDPRKSKALSISENPVQVQLPTKRRQPKLGSLPLKSGANEILAGPVHPLASYMQLPDQWHRF